MKTLDDMFGAPEAMFKGRVKKIYFEDDSTDFYIFMAEDLHTRKTRKIKGHFFSPRIFPGAEFEVREGEWEKSPKYGSTFVVLKAGPVRDSLDSRVEWVRNSCPSIGRINARKIAIHFENSGVDLQTGMEDLSALESLTYLPTGKALQIFQEWRSRNSYADAADYLTGLGLPSGSVKSVYEALGEDTVQTVNDNPYALALADGVTFPQADQIALNSGFTKDSQMRIASILEYMLDVAARRNGHLYLDKDSLLKALERLPKREKVKGFGRSLKLIDIADALDDRVAKGRVVVDGDKVYLKQSFDVEHGSAQLLQEFSGTVDLDIDMDEFLAEYERIYGISFSDQQAEAVRALNDTKVLLLTGLPGTGKSTVTKALVRLFEKADKTYTLMAPTGIAAKRLSTVVGSQAGTIHRTLGFSGDSWSFNERNKFMTDVVIVDEVSMVDQTLLYRLLSALNPSTTLVFVGDNAQLPSVGAGNVLHEMIASQAIRRVHLTEIFRQHGASDIVLNAHRINSGDDLLLGDPTDKNTDFRFIHLTDPDEIMAGVLHVVKNLYASSADVSYQVISPTYKGPLGVDRFNDEIKELLNPKTRQQEVTLRRRSFREDDRLMIVKNNYNFEIYNGEIGKLHQIKRKEKLLRIKIFDEPDDRMLELPFASAASLTTLAYALTVHRCCHPDTLVETSEGLLRIKDVVGEGSVSTSRGVRPYLNKVHNNAAPAIEIVTEDGYSLTVTPDHEVIVWTGSGYERVQAQDLTSEHFVALKLGVGIDPKAFARTPAPPVRVGKAHVYSLPEEVDEDLAEFLGLMIADGTVTSKSFSLTKRHPEVVSRFCELTQKLFDKSPSIYSRPSFQTATVSSVYLSKWLTTIGGLNSKQKAIPECILRSPSFIQAKFLRGLFEDGSIHLQNRKGVSYLDHIELTSSSKDLLKTVQVMLLRFGVISNLSMVNNSTFNVMQARLWIYGENALTFGRHIGFISPSKSARFSFPVGRSTKYKVPVSRHEVCTKIGRSNLKLSHYQNARERGYMSRHTVSLYDFDFLKERSTYHHSRVKTLNPTECETYCFEVPDGNEFFQNGMRSGNCQGQEFDYVILPFHSMFSIQLQRNLLYTAVTRAKKKVFIFGEYKALLRAINNDSVAQRNTDFSRRLRELLG